MIKKRNILFSSIFIILILTVSCTSTRYYGINTTDLRTQLTGNILVKPKNTDFYDIILDGETKLDIGLETSVSPNQCTIFRSDINNILAKKV